MKGWLEARDVEVAGSMHTGRRVLVATVGPASDLRLADPEGYLLP